MHGLEAIQRNKDGEENEANVSGEGLDMSRRSSVSEKTEEDRNSAASKLIVFLCGFLDGEVRLIDRLVMRGRGLTLVGRAQYQRKPKRSGTVTLPAD